MTIVFASQTCLSRLLGVMLTILLGTATATARRNDDVVILKNGDRLTGEIKSLQRGELSFKADYMAESVRLDWSKVERLESRSEFLILLTNGQLFTGSLKVSAVLVGRFSVEWCEPAKSILLSINQSQAPTYPQ